MKYNVLPFKTDHSRSTLLSNEDQVENESLFLPRKPLQGRVEAQHHCSKIMRARMKEAKEAVREPWHLVISTARHIGIVSLNKSQKIRHT